MKKLINRIMNGEKRDQITHEKLILENTLELIDAFEIEYNNEYILSSNENMADRIFWAAVDLLENVGIFSPDANRAFNVSRNEILSNIRNARTGMFIGENIDKIFFGSRNTYKNHLPMIMGGPAMAPISPEYYVPIHRSYIKLNSIDSIAPGVFYCSDHRVTTNNPLHLINAHRSIDYLKRACTLEARSGMCIVTPPFIEDPVSAISITNSRFMSQGDLQEIIVGTNLQVT
ncbi:MAG: monomethylamine:corrinoid methyltransferase, partial [Methanosarcinaceae archaeon]|nr:monomethylamine:corrinoid methyltransferase [Methanosarcinaceae archaeon]